MSDSAETCAGSNRTQSLKKRIAQLQAELRAVRQQFLAQRQRIAQKCGLEFLILIDQQQQIKIQIANIDLV